jgi:U3 small nucleolar RNA-associated protein 19
MLAVAFVHNIIRRHPACMVMLHKPTAATAAAGSNDPPPPAAAVAAAAAAAGVDVYDAGESDPAKSRAVESSLWEVEALRNHASPQVGLEGGSWLRPWGGGQGEEGVIGWEV